MLPPKTETFRGNPILRDVDGNVVEKWCPRCEELLPVSNFRKVKRSNTRTAPYDAYCKPCTKIYKKEYATRDREKYRDLRRKWKYGMAEGSYSSMLDEQNRKCAICFEEKPLHVDHSHSTGEVRGLLCSSCNTALGKFRDSELILNNAIAYLRGN